MVSVKKGYAGLLSDVYDGRLEARYEQKYMKFFEINLRKVLSQHIFSSEDIQILNLRYGLDGRDPVSFREVGESVGVSEWTIQRRVAALQKALRTNCTEEILLGKKKENPSKEEDIENA